MRADRRDLALRDGGLEGVALGVIAPQDDAPPVGDADLEADEPLDAFVGGDRFVVGLVRGDVVALADAQLDGELLRVARREVEAVNIGEDLDRGRDGFARVVVGADARRSFRTSR